MALQRVQEVTQCEHLAAVEVGCPKQCLQLRIQPAFVQEHRPNVKAAVGDKSWSCFDDQRQGNDISSRRNIVSKHKGGQ